MPDISTHQPAAIASGAAAAFLCAPGQPAAARFVEMIGGAGGGWATGMLADKLDPPEHPHHRGLGHAVIPNALVTAGAITLVSEWQQSLRRNAAEFEIKAALQPSGYGGLFYHFLALVCRFVSGALSGAIAGHWSHLVLDSRTPFGIPLLVPGY